MRINDGIFLPCVSLTMLKLCCFGIFSLNLFHDKQWLGYGITKKQVIFEVCFSIILNNPPHRYFAFSPVRIQKFL